MAASTLAQSDAGLRMRPRPAVTVWFHSSLRKGMLPRLSGILDTEHYFVMEPAHASTTTVMTQGAVEYGLWTPIASLFLSGTARHFEVMNQALKSRAAPRAEPHPLS